MMIRRNALFLCPIDQWRDDWGRYTFKQYPEKQTLLRMKLIKRARQFLPQGSAMQTRPHSENIVPVLERKVIHVSFTPPSRRHTMSIAHLIRRAFSPDQKRIPTDSFGTWGNIAHNVECASIISLIVSIVSNSV
jgi:hypothetical protein